MIPDRAMTSGNDNARGQAGEIGNADSNQRNGFILSAPASVKLAFPDPRYLPGRVLAILLTGRRITHLDSWRELGHARLADSIWKLRRLGWSVVADDEVMATSDGGRQATVAVYRLPPEAIAVAGERGQKYAADCARIEAGRRAS